MSEEQFPKGTPVRVTQTDRYLHTETVVVGVIEAWEELPTGSWHAHGRSDVPGGSPKFWLKRLKIRKLDGEMTLLVVDDSTRIAKLAPAKPK